MGLINEHKVMFVIDNDLMNSKYLECHPCINTATLKIKVTDLLEKINYATGIIWQVQYSVKGDDYRFKSTLNRFSLLPEGQKEIAGRFELYKTQNLYNFILVDTRDGRTWQVQWSTEPDNRGIMPIL